MSLYTAVNNHVRCGEFLGTRREAATEMRVTPAETTSSNDASKHALSEMTRHDNTRAQDPQIHSVRSPKSLQKRAEIHKSTTGGPQKFTKDPQEFAKKRTKSLFYKRFLGSQLFNVLRVNLNLQEQPLF